MATHPLASDIVLPSARAQRPSHTQRLARLPRAQDRPGPTRCSLLALRSRTGAWPATCVKGSRNRDAWRVTLDLPAGTAVEYKFLIGIPGPDGKHISHFSWMPGENFRFEVPRRGGTTVEDRWPANQ